MGRGEAQSNPFLTKLLVSWGNVMTNFGYCIYLEYSQTYLFTKCISSKLDKPMLLPVNVQIIAG